MRKDLEIFENRSDDWLAKQRKYEEKVSAWDFDEGRKIKEEHHKRHVAYEKKELKSKVKSSIRNDATDKQVNLNVARFMLVMSLIILFALFMMSMGY